MAKLLTVKELNALDTSAMKKKELKAHKALLATAVALEAETVPDSGIEKEAAPKKLKGKALAKQKAAELKAKFELVAPKPKKSKAAIEKDINSKVTNAAKTDMEIGGLLNAAKYYFQKEGKAQVDSASWATWAFESFGIKKSQAYSLVAVHAVFGDNELLSTLPISVLVMLKSEDKMMAAAEEAKEQGEEINATWVTAWKKENLVIEDKTGDDSEGGEGEGGEGGESASAAQRAKDELLFKQMEDKIEELEAKLKDSAAEIKELKKSSKAKGATPEEVSAAVTAALAAQSAKVLKQMNKAATPYLVLNIKEGAANRAVTSAVTFLTSLYGEKSECFNKEIMAKVKEAQAAIKSK